MIELKQSTSHPDTFFAHDANGDGVTGLVNGDFTKRISKNGGAFGAMTVTITELENGWYAFTLSASHTDTLGALTITFAAAGIKLVNHKYVVRTITLDDLESAAKFFRNKVTHTIADGKIRLYDDDNSTVHATWTPTESAGVVAVTKS